MQDDAAGLIGALKDSGVEDNAATRSFASELLGRVPRQQAGPSQAQLQQRAAAAVVRKNRSYGLLDGKKRAFLTRLPFWCNSCACRCSELSLYRSCWHTVHQQHDALKNRYNYVSTDSSLHGSTCAGDDDDEPAPSTSGRAEVQAAAAMPPPAAKKLRTKSSRAAADDDDDPTVVRRHGHSSKRR